jgi:hypothetical protein
MGNRDLLVVRSLLHPKLAGERMDGVAVGGWELGVVWGQWCEGVCVCMCVCGDCGDGEVGARGFGPHSLSASPRSVFDVS